MHLLKAYSSAYWPVRKAAVEALGQLGNTDSKVIDTFHNVLSGSADWQVKLATIRALSTLQIDRIIVDQHIQKLLNYYAPFVYRQFSANAIANDLMATLLHIVGEA